MEADLTTPVLSQANAVGQGFDIYGAFSTASLKIPLFDLESSGTKTFTMLGHEYLIPSCVTAIEDPDAYFDDTSAQTREQLQNDLSVHAGVEISAGAFSGEMQADFAAAFEQSSQFAYVYRKFYSQIAYVELGDAGAYVTDEFATRISQLPDQVTPANLDLFYQFFSEFGVYYVQKVVLGGGLDLCSSVKLASELTSLELSAMIAAQYEALTSSGSIDAKVAASSEWQRYSQDASCTIRAFGGSSGAVAALTAVDPLKPSSDSVGAYRAWLGSVDSDPAIVDLSLAGIWNLCGAKSQAVREAWESFRDLMHPSLTLNTSATFLPWPTPPPVPPIVILSSIPGPLRPAAPPASAAGWQVLVLDATKLATADAVVYDAYHALPPQNVWISTYKTMYDELASVLTPYLSARYIIVLVSFAIDQNMLPTPSMQQVMRSAGAGPVLDYWSQHCDPGSEIGNDAVWIANSFAYALVGIGASRPGDAIEQYVRCGWKESRSLSVDVEFYRRSYDGSYTIGLGS